MRSQVVADRYARALLEALPTPGAVDGVLEELQAVAALVRDNARFRSLLEGPVVSPANKKAIVGRTLDGKADPTTIHFLYLLIDRYRIDHLEEVVGRLQELVEERRGQLRVVVTTAVQLGEDMLQRLKRALDATTDKDCILETRVDARVLGGVVCVLGDRVIDGSLRTELLDMKRALMSAGAQ